MEYENLLHAQVTCAEHVHTLEREAREHLDAPASQATHCRQLLEDFFVCGGDELASGEFACDLCVPTIAGSAIWDLVMLC